MNSQPSPSAVALVTGAADRIGAAIARKLAEAGASVVIHYRASSATAEKLAAGIVASGGKAALVQADLTRRDDRRGVIAAAAALFGPLTILINNASLFEPDSIDDLDEDLWDRHFALHVEAPAFLARDFARQLPAGAEGNIVNIIDERVLHLTPAYFSYTLSKSVLWSATRTLAQTLAPAIRVNAIGPGPVLPHARQDHAAFNAHINALLLNDHAGPQAIADGVLILLNTPSMTGQMLALDGGQHLEYPARRAPTPRS
jgi:NAD(P)-dependent dehydrogenase (short-subunit alcohol dehydrogenase family)